MEDKSIYNKKKTGRKTRQKGFGWYGSLNPNAGNVEKNIEIFNNAQPDGFTATSPVNGNAMGENIEQEKPKRYPIYMWKALEDAVAGMSNIPDEHKEKFISLVGDRATVKRVPGVGHKSALLPTSLRNKYGYTNANYNTLVTKPENFNLTLEQGLTDIYDVMKSKWFKDEELEEATTSIKYSYTGPIYHLGNKIAEKSKLYTMAKSWKQAKNNFLYKIANGDIVGHYDLVDDFVKEVPKATLDTPAIEEKPEIIKCDNCGTQLNPMGECPVCDYGEDDLLESIHIDSNLDAISQLNRMDEIV